MLHIHVKVWSENKGLVRWELAEHGGMYGIVAGFRGFVFFKVGTGSNNQDNSKIT